MAAEKIENTVANSDVVTKYKAAGDIAQRVLNEVKALVVPGAKVYDIVVKGDELLTAELAKVFSNKKDMSKGISFPTSVSVDDCVAYFSPLETDESLELKAGSIAKVMLGAQIDGYASVVSDSVVVGGDAEASPELRQALAAAWYATEAALRTVKPGYRNLDVTNIVKDVTKEFGVTALEGMLSMQHKQNNVAGEKRIVLNPNAAQRNESQKFEENEVYGLDILVAVEGSTGKTKSKETPTNIYRPTELKYTPKLRSSRAAMADVQRKAGHFPFNVRILEDQRRARIALREPLDHGSIEAYDVVYEKDGKKVVQLFTTFALTKTGINKFAAPTQPVLDGAKKPEGEELVKLLSTSLKTNKKKK